jgi:hypothetical protein
LIEDNLFVPTEETDLVGKFFKALYSADKAYCVLYTRKDNCFVVLFSNALCRAKYMYSYFSINSALSEPGLELMEDDGDRVQLLLR